MLLVFVIKLIIIVIVIVIIISIPCRLRQDVLPGL